MDKQKRHRHAGLSTISRKSDDVASYYDKWASDYDTTLAEWRYTAPERVASILGNDLSQDSQILDAGCGTGLIGRALHSRGFTAIDGIDISNRSLKIAGKAGVYRTLWGVDMQQLPLPISDGRYDGLVCVGVLTYLPDSIGMLREFSRVVRPDGIVVVSQRSDLFIERDFKAVLEQLQSERSINHLQISEPEPYLPENEEFSDQILVHYISYKIESF